MVEALQPAGNLRRARPASQERDIVARGGGMLRGDRSIIDGIGAGFVRDLFPGNEIPGSRFDDTGKKVADGVYEYCYYNVSVR